MLRHINHDYALEFENPRDQWLSEQIMLWNLNILAVRDVHYIQDHPDVPLSYDDVNCIYLLPESLERSPSKSQLTALRAFLSSTMKMTPDEIEHHVDLARGVEIFRDVPRMREHGGGDCDNWSGRRSAELVVAGVNAKPRMTCRQQDGRTIYHALVIHPDGSTEDPSLIKGMGGVNRKAERFEECRKNWERYKNLCDEAKLMIESEDIDGSARDERVAQLQATIDKCGYLPKSGVFMVGQPKSVAIVGLLSARRDRVQVPSNYRLPSRRAA